MRLHTACWAIRRCCITVGWGELEWALASPIEVTRVDIISFSFFKKWANPGLFFVYLWTFQKINTNFTINQCEKCPSSIRRRDSNPRPFEHESSPITTRPGLPPSDVISLNADQVCNTTEASARLLSSRFKRGGRSHYTWKVQPFLFCCKKAFLTASSSAAAAAKKQTKRQRRISSRLPLQRIVRYCKNELKGRKKDSFLGRSFFFILNLLVFCRISKFDPTRASVDFIN